MHDIPQDRQVPGCSSRPAGDGGGFRNCGEWTEPRGEHPQEFTGTLVTLRAAKGGARTGRKASEAARGAGLHGVKRNLGIKLRDKIKQVQGRAVEAGRSV